MPAVPTDDPVASAPVRIGVLGLKPRVGLTNFGWDTNVFNEVNDPKRDFTFAVKPGTELWLRTGKGLLSFEGDLELVYFNQYSTERAINSNAKGQYELRFNRIRPYASASTLNTKQRPGYEIDARARHYETDFHVGNDLKVASKSTVRLDFQHLDYSFAGDEVFNGRPLNQQLNRTLQGVSLGWRQRLTALTTWITTMSRESERFEFEDLRNNDSFRLSSGFELGRFALIRGRAFMGYRKLTAADGGLLPEFSGVTANADVAYTAPTQTRLGAIVSRDIQYSYENRTPYYVQTSWTATLTQSVTGRWDAQLTGGRDRLAYQFIVTSADARTDFVGRFGGGIGYSLGDQTRVSFDVTSFYRTSQIPGREYGSIRAGLSVTYGY
ncbi:MAG: outer membrane beta-barrel protein [Vicinamibacterales bacterium]